MLLGSGRGDPRLGELPAALRRRSVGQRLMCQVGSGQARRTGGAGGQVG